MRHWLLIGTVLVAWAGEAAACGIVMPTDPKMSPLAMIRHKVAVTIEDQVAVTQVEQTFRNATEQALPATYVFPVPRGASVSQFSMAVDGKEVKGELLEAARARAIYTDLIRRSQDPALLEYLDHHLLRMHIAAVPARADVQLSVRYTAVAARDGDTIEYTYPLKTDGKANRTLEEFGLTATLKGQHRIHNVYSPTHALAVKRTSDREVSLAFERAQTLLDKDFRLFYSLGDTDIGLTALTHRPLKTENGYFLMLLTPRVELAKENQIARDVVLVLDTSGSMRGVKLEQAKKALKFCLGNLGPHDRFGMIEFASQVRKYRNTLTASTSDEIGQARQWVDQLKATSATNINDALLAALAMRADDPARTFTVIFFTDGMPTTSERNPEKILKNVLERNSGNTRIFSFGVGNDVNASFLDRLAEQTRALSTYVRPHEDIEEKVSNLYSKISNPVLANLKLSVSPEVTVEEVYPPQLRDLFEGGQLVVLGRYRGHGAAQVKLNGTVGKDAKELVYKVAFAEETGAARDFVEQLWASRKVGYLLDQIRVNGAKKELVDEVTVLAKKYGITTPYTSYLIVTDGAMPVAGKGRSTAGTAKSARPNALAPQAPGAAPQKVTEFAKNAQAQPGDLANKRGKFEDEQLQKAPDAAKGDKDALKAQQEAHDKKATNDQARAALARQDARGVQSGKLGVDLSVQGYNLRNQCQLQQSAVRRVANRNCLEIGGVWIDEGYDAKMPTVAVKAMSDAYFRILEKQPQVREVFRLGNHLVWVTPSGTALVIDTEDGKESLTDEAIQALFVVKK